MAPDEFGGDIIDRLAGLPDAAFGEFDGRGQPIVDDAEEPDGREELAPEPAEAQTVETTTEGETVEAQEPVKSQEPEKTAEAAEQGDDYVEVPGENGADPERIPVSQLVESHRKLTALGGDLNALRNQLETAFTSKMTPVLQKQIEARENYVKRYEQILQWSPVGDPPSTELLDSRSDKYDPDRYNYQTRIHAERKAAHEKALAHVEAEKKKLEADRAEERDAQIDREAANLLRAWPELQDAQKASQIMADFYGGLQQAYGWDQATMQTVTDHRVYMMARDALAYRKMMADGGKTVAAKAAAKLVKGAARQAPAATAKAKTAKVRDVLRKTGSIEAAAAAFEGLDL